MYMYMPEFNRSKSKLYTYTILKIKKYWKVCYFSFFFRFRQKRQIIPAFQKINNT